MREGWICPRCQKVWSPDITCCNCSGTVTNINPRWWECPGTTGTYPYPTVIFNTGNTYTTEES